MSAVTPVHERGESELAALWEEFKESGDERAREGLILDKTNADVLDEATPRISVGAGISWQSPFGPIILDLGFAVLDEPFDKDELLNFSFGTQF